ncbi:response regulator [Aeromonas sp. 603404]|uniref:response regulator n=1 Tax=unclassified Aeromonas TaxID=257493 RepID=UPI003B9F50E7
MRCLSLFLIISIFSPICISDQIAEFEGYEQMSIFSRESVSTHFNHMPLLTHQEKAWLKKRDKLVLAVPKPDNPPMDITLRAYNYEGVTADIIGIISKSLAVNIVAKTFPSREAAITAIKNGEADFIGSANSYEVGEGLSLTKPYIADEPALYKRFGVKEKNIKRVAIAESYLPFSEIIRYLPGMKIDLYSSRYAAVAAAAYGKADAVLIDMISGNFIINKLYNDSIQLVRPIYADTSGFSFAVNPENSTLKDILNSALGSVSAMHINSIIKRWSGGGLSIHSDKVNLTTREWQWINDKESITIAVSKDLPPVSFVDKHGNLHGVVADLFQVLRSKLGLRIDILPMANTQDEISAIDSGKADLMIMTPTEERSKKYIFSRAVALDPLVYIVNKNKKEMDPETLLKVGRVAILKGAFYSEEAAKRYNMRKGIVFDSVEKALTCVAKENCDVTILPLRVAKFFVNADFPESLYIADELFDSAPFGASFAGTPSQKELIAIFDKVLALIPPDELEGLATRWRVSAKQDPITWHDAVREFGLIISIVFAIFILGIFWSLALWRQIQQRKQVEAALGSQLKFIEELVESTPHPIYARDKEGNLILCNNSYVNFFGIDKWDLMYTPLVDLKNRYPAVSILEQVFHQTLSDGKPREGDYHVHLQDREVDLYHWLQVYRDLSGDVKGVVGGWIDISERTALVRKLAQASQNAQEASRAKSTFLATMSHEIRTPMNAIIGLLELTLRKDALTTSDRESIAIAHQSAHDLLALIGDILDISKIESGKLELLPTPNRVADLTRSVVNVFSASARQKELMLNLTVHNDATVMIDPIRYKQILSNLLSNAIKFTRKGGVEVSLEIKTESEDDLCEILLIVNDSGIGISKSDQEMLFQPFAQARQPVDLQKSGTGLGLMISRTLCQMMGGNLTIKSEVGEGCQVKVSLLLPLLLDASLEEVETPIEEIPSDSVSQALRVLIIDDHPTNRLLVSEQLTFLGHVVMAASSAAEALQWLGTQNFDIIITDFNMPEMDGLELATRYRDLEFKEKRKRTIIIGLTADARQKQIHKAMEAGMDDCLFKPVSLDELQLCISTHQTGYIDTPPSEVADAINQRLYPLTAGRTDLMTSLLAEFLRAADDDLAALERASLAGDNQAFLSNIHRLKGGARIIGADVLVACCVAWEQSARLSMCMPSALRQIQHIYEQLKAGVRYWEEHGMKVS